MSEDIQCKRCFISAEELRSEGELGESLLIGVLGYCIACCPKKKLIKLAGVIKQELNDRWMH